MERLNPGTELSMDPYLNLEAYTRMHHGTLWYKGLSVTGFAGIGQNPSKLSPNVGDTPNDRQTGW